MRILALATALLLPEAPAVDPRVTRSGSHLEMAWTSAEAGTWELLDTEGHICASGRARAGDNVVTLPKVAAPTELRFRRRDADGNDLSVTRIPAARALSALRKPQRGAVIYQLPPRSFLARASGESGAGKLNDLDEGRLREIKELGADYLWLTGVLEHASRSQNDADVVKGDAGSYYAIYDSWDVSAQIGTLGDFERLIDRAHAAGLRVIIDFVANHTARVHRTDVACKQHLDFGRTDRTDEFFRPDNNYYYIGGSSFTPPAQPAPADGTFDTDVFAPGIQLETPAKVTGNDIVDASPQDADWFETVKLNYGWDLSTRQARYNPRPRTWDQMVDVAKYWVEKGVDGFRVDYAHAVPIEFWRFFARELRAVQPDVFLLAEAYAGDYRMMIPGFSYEAMLDAGFDSVYHSEIYWALRRQVNQPGDMRSATPARSPGFAAAIVDRGFMFTHYMENHDEHRVASRYFAEWVGDRADRADLGLAYTAYLGLLPGHLMLQAGQELQEDASIPGPFRGDMPGKTSIFDFVHQSQSRLWNFGQRPAWMTEFRSRYRDLLALKKRPAFATAHSFAVPTMMDLDGINGYKEQSRWVSAYVRFGGGEAYLVVANSDPFVAHEATVHLTSRDGQDSHGALAAMGIVDDERRYVFKEVFARRDWVPRDPAIAGDGLPGWALYRSGNIPSGIFLGSVPPATTYVFKIEAR